MVRNLCFKQFSLNFVVELQINQQSKDRLYTVLCSNPSLFPLFPPPLPPPLLLTPTLSLSFSSHFLSLSISPLTPPSSDIGRDLEKDVVSETSGDFKRVLVALLQVSSVAFVGQTMLCPYCLLLTREPNVWVTASSQLVARLHACTLNNELTGSTHLYMYLIMISSVVT